MTARGTGAKKPPPDDTALRRAVLEAALGHAAFDGFNDGLLAKAGAEVGVVDADLARLFPSGVAGLLVASRVAEARIRDRIRQAVLTRLSLLRPHKEAARRAAAFLSLPPNAPLAAKLLWQSADRMWRGIGDTATDFNFYTKRTILIGVYSATLVRWFNDQSEDEADTHAFLDRRIEDVMRFEKFKARLKEEASRLPSLGEILGGFNRSNPRS
ncbi:MAG: COQ9 family protein [Alphaproteobacteria bacterium]|nr:COQ9 family protein [Alphaproteobacteria bacterium]